MSEIISDKELILHHLDRIIRIATELKDDVVKLKTEEPTRTM